MFTTNKIISSVVDEEALFWFLDSLPVTTAAVLLKSAHSSLLMIQI